MATTRRSSVPKEEPTPSKPRKRSDASAKAGKAKPKGAAPAKKVKQPAKVTKARAPKPTKTATQAVAAAASGLPDTSTDTSDHGLTLKQQLFADQYLIDLNATRAYLRVNPGVKDTTASVEGSRILGMPKVQAYITEQRDRTSKRLEITRERILLEVARIAFFDPRRLYKADGSPVEFTTLDDDTVAAIAGLEVLEEFDGSGEDRHLVGHVKKYKIADKKGALDMLMKHKGLYEQDNDQKTRGFAEAVAAFADGLRARGAGRLPMAPPKQGGDKA